MTGLREAAQQALETLEWHLERGAYGADIEGVACALKTALAEPVQEPVAWMDIDRDGTRVSVRMWTDGNRDEVPLYTAPPQRKPLPDEEMRKLWSQYGYKSALCMRFARAIERAHGIKE